MKIWEKFFGSENENNKVFDIFDDQRNVPVESKSSEDVVFENSFSDDRNQTTEIDSYREHDLEECKDDLEEFPDSDEEETSEEEDREMDCLEEYTTWSQRMESRPKINCCFTNLAASTFCPQVSAKKTGKMKKKMSQGVWNVPDEPWKPIP